MIRVGGVKQHNGLAFAEDDSAAELRLRRVGGRGHVPLGGTLPSEFRVRLIPGAYAFEYDWEAGRHDSPKPPRGRSPNGPREERGQPGPERAECRPGFRLPPQRRRPFRAPCTPTETSFSAEVTGRKCWPAPLDQPPTTVRLIPGTYDAHWRYVAGSRCRATKTHGSGEGLVIDGSPQVIDVPSLEVSGDILLNGQAPPHTAYENAQLSLASADGVDRAYLGQTFYGGFSSRVVPGLLRHRL